MGIKKIHDAVAPFYERVLSDLFADRTLAKQGSILVVCGGDLDFRMMQKMGFENVTISNLGDHDCDENRTTVYEEADAENLPYPDNSFDFVMVHSGLHHCLSPHKAILEMYRVARRGVLGFEPNDCLFTRAGVKLGVGQQYETAAVYYNGCKSGGARNTCIPNYVYRFSAQEIQKVICCNAPAFQHRFRFWYETRMAFDFPNASFPIRLSVKFLRGAIIWMAERIPALANNIAFFIEKPGHNQVHPWIVLKEGGLDVSKDYLDRVYRDSKCQGE